MTFPLQPHLVRSVLIVMPEIPLEALHTLSTVYSLVEKMPHARIACTCVMDVVPFLEGLPPRVSRFVYESQERYLLSAEMKKLAETIEGERFDAVFLLENAPHSALLFLVCRSRARFRIGFAEACGFPFINMQIRRGRVQRFRAYHYRACAAALGIETMAYPRWTVSEKAQREVAVLLDEHSIAPEATLIGIDIEALLRRYGRRCVATIIGELTKSNHMAVYAYAPYAGDAERRWLRDAGVAAVIGGGSIAQLAGLVARSACVVGGRGVLFELGHLLHIDSIGLFDVEEMSVYCASESHCHGIVCEGRHSAAAIEELLITVNSILGQKK